MLQRFKAALDNVSVLNKEIAIISIPLLVLILTLLLMSWHERVSREYQSRIRHSLLVKASLYRFLALITDSEGGVRGYRLWNDPVYLDPYNTAVSNIDGSLDGLKSLVHDNNEQTSYIMALEKQAYLKLGYLHEMVTDVSAIPTASDPATLASRASMRNIRTYLRALEHTEDMLLENRIKEYETVVARLDALLILLLTFALFYGMSASYIVSSSILKRVKNLEIYARKVSRSQPAEFQDSGEDELGMLGRNVQAMTNNLLSREEALRQTRGQLQKANDSLAAQLHETRAVNQELESFSYSVSHDLRAPLRHVTGFSKLLNESTEKLSPKNQRYLDIIQTSVEQMGVLIDELLEFSRLSRTDLKSDNVDLNKVIDQVLTDLSPEVTKRNIEWKVDQLPTIPGDQVMMKLVFQNLISNALKYSRDQNPAVIEIIQEKDAPQSTVRISISDNGTGFDMKYQEKLFRVFQRLHSSEEYEGTGIGLATVKRIILRHNGDITAYSTPGQGAKFTMTLRTKTTSGRTK